MAICCCSLGSDLRSDTRLIPKTMIINSVERTDCVGSRIDMNAIDTTKILASTPRGVHVYDIRNLNKRIFTTENHQGDVTNAKWSPHRDLVYASCSKDRKVLVTDIGEVDRYSMNDPGQIQMATIFPHSGHKEEVRNVDWNKSENHLFVSNDSNSLHIWKVSDKIYESSKNHSTTGSVSYGSNN